MQQRYNIEGRAMGATKLTSCELKHDTKKAKRAAKNGPVFITDRERPTHVLLTAEEYARITGGNNSAAELLAMPEAAAIHFDPPLFPEKEKAAPFGAANASCAVSQRVPTN